MRTSIVLARLGLALAFAALATSAPAAEKTLVVGSSFIIKSLDPGRTIETTSNMINHSVYDSLVTFDGEDLRDPKPSLATDWKVADDGKTYTFRLRRNVKFSSGNPLTSADVKWSLDRVKNLKNNPAFFLNSVDEILAPDPYTVVLKLKAPNPALLPILASSSLAALDSKLVTQKGGDASADAKDRDKAESFLNGQSAGTGAYVLERYVPEHEVVLVRNPAHWRGAPKLDRIVVRNITEPASQKLQLERGDLDIATGLDQDQMKALRSAAGVMTKTSPAATTFYILLNANPQIGGPFANPKVQQAVRYALDYEGILAIAGPGAVRLAGVIPTSFPGSLDPRQAIRTDREKAKALLKDANLGEVKGVITYASDSTIWGVQMSLLAQKIQADLAAVGIGITLNGLPRTTALQLYRDGKNQLGVWSWAADYPDGQNFLVYAPGRTVGKRAGWLPEASPEARELAQVATEAETQGDPARSAGLYRKFEERLAQIGPYAPLFQPAVPYAFRSNVQGVTFNSVWGVDFWTIGK
ncbi:MAG TPA: ABC transporter substrate-binding protein [Methylomirabilota bacterium]|nr:ABC transporter substrate-binding protein [Methylomirabilota bacterium]